MSRTARWFYLMVGAQGLFLLGWAGFNEAALRRSPTVLLEVRPVDPSEILRGDYMILSYDIQTIPKDRIAPGAPGVDYGDEVCVRIAPHGEFWRAIAARPGACGGAPPPPEGTYDLSGIRTYGWGDSDDAIAIDYGIGRYYVPEGKGTPGGGALTARVAITPWHRAMIREIYRDGEPYP